MADVFHDNNIIGNDVQTGLGYDYQKTNPHSACGRDEVLQMSTVTSSESDHQRDAISKSIQQRKGDSFNPTSKHTCFLSGRFGSPVKRRTLGYSV